MASQSKKNISQEFSLHTFKQLATAQKARVKAIASTQDRLWFVTYFLILISLAVFRYLVEQNFFSFLAHYQDLLYRIASAAMLAVLIIAAYRAIRIYAIGRIDNMVAQYNLNQLLKLVVGILLIFIGISLFFVNWYAAVVSLGLISLVLGFALQTPIASFIGWMYILIRAPYRVGDRIKIGDATGDVIEIGYLDTALWEFGGPHVSTDHPSGRLIKFPNSEVFTSAVYNYSWPLFPYMWHEVKFQVAYESDLEFVAQIMQRMVQEELGDEMQERIKQFRQLLEQMPIEHLEVQDQPEVIFHVNENTWLDAVVRYVVEPKDAGRVRSQLIQKILKEFKANPDKVMLPLSNVR